jgi:AcrR family transcriptional regulator
MLQKGRKETQRERILAGMVAASNREGYAGATVSEVIAEAGISRPTFYDYFAGRDECFLATLIDTQERLHEEIAQAVAEEPPERALRGAVAGLLAFAGSEPAHARFVMNEALGGGPRALDARDEGIHKVAKLIEKAERAAAAEDATPDLPLWLIIGAVHRMLGSRLRRGVPGLRGLEEDLLSWVASYETPTSEHRWRLQPPPALSGRSKFVPEGRMRPPMPLAPGRPRLTEEEVSENHRQRLFFAAARLAGERGYTATTIAAITERAGLDRRAFYELFKDKREAYMAVHEFGFQRLLAVTAGAFFAGASWPERIWEGGKGLTQFMEENPTFANVGFVEAYAVGPGAVQRVEDSVSAFTVFLQEGYQYQPREQTPPRLALEAIVTSFFELVYHEARRSASPQTRRLLPVLAFVCLAPFLGEVEANRFIEGQLKGQKAQGAAGIGKAPERGRKRVGGTGKSASR